MFRRSLLGLIWLYQKTVSPDHGPLRAFFPYGYCKYQPTCSNYMKEAVQRYGFFRGVWRGVGRIIRCNPFAKGGPDLVK